MSKTTRAQIESKCQALNRLLGMPTEPYTEVGGKYRANIGNIHLDHNSTGWQVQQMHSDSGGVTCPLGDYRLTAFECWLALNAACAAVQMTQARLVIKEAA